MHDHDFYGGRMFSRLAFALVLCFSFALSAPAQQVVRFETTVGDFDMVLNPTNNPVLADYAQNLVNYVERNNYLGSWINRADTGFVLQMGGFFSATKRPPPTIDSTRPVQAFVPVQGHPASQLGLSNTVGTVSLALPGNGSGGTDQNAGTSSFFVNLTDNSFLDTDFTVFSAIPDMTTINAIMALSTIDRTQDANFGAGSGNLGFAKVPVADNGFQVFIKRAFLINDTLTSAKDMAGIQSIMSASASGGSNSALPFSASAIDGGGAGSSLSLSPGSVPEPASAVIAMIGALAASCVRRRR